MDAPKSDKALRRWREFTAAVHDRLIDGKESYGDSSFERPMEDIVHEIRQECEDVAGWAFIAWSRLIELEERIKE